MPLKRYIKQVLIETLSKNELITINKINELLKQTTIKFDKYLTYSIYEKGMQYYNIESYTFANPIFNYSCYISDYHYSNQMIYLLHKSFLRYTHQLEAECDNFYRFFIINAHTIRDYIYSTQHLLKNFDIAIAAGNDYIGINLSDFETAISVADNINEFIALIYQLGTIVK